MGPNDEDDGRSPGDSTPTVAGPLGRVSRAGPLEPAGDRYSLGEVIARGGMGEVVLAHDRDIGRPVAIKRMIVDDPAAGEVDRFLREAKIQGRLDHPAIVPVHELARDRNGRPFFVMKRLAGRTLADVLDGHRHGDRLALDKFPRQRLLRAFADVCLAIEFAHDRGVIHRDLKPANVMLGDFGEVYVIDWGIARVVGDPEPTPNLRSTHDAIVPVAGSTQPGTRLGTPGYMSPEQAAGMADVDARSDVYSLGCILFEIVTGDALQLVDARVPADRDIPPELEVLWTAATARDRDRRVGSARELVERVERYLDGDRDLERRREVAREHVARAAAALAAPGADADRTAVAIREAGRALVLDPTSTEAADLVRRSMIEPPVQTPAEVEREIAAANARASRDIARLSILGYLAYPLFIPVMMLLGVRDYGYIAAMLVIVALNALLGWFGILGWRSRWRTIGVIAVHGAMAALLTRMFGLPIVAPGALSVTLMAMIAHQTYASKRAAIGLVSFMIAAMLAPFIAELLGLISRTLTVTNDTVVLRPPAVHQVPGLIEAVFILWTSAMVAIASAMAWFSARRDRTTRLALRIQAWRLRQVVPSAPAAAGFVVGAAGIEPATWTV